MKIQMLMSLLLLFALSACQPKTASNDSSKDIVDPSGIGGNNPGNGGNPGSGGGGVGPGAPLIELDMMLSGGKNWVPGNYANSLARETMINLEEAHVIFKSDSRMKVRFKVFAQPKPPKGEKYCFDRTVGQATAAYKYTKLQFTVYLRDLICNNIDPNDSSKCLSFSLGGRYRTQPVGPVKVGEYSEVLNFSNVRNASSWGTTVEVAYVNTDISCQSGNTYDCEAASPLQSGSCWKMMMQVSTDYTQDMI